MAKTVSRESLEKKIEKAQESVIKTKAAYEKANKILKDLLDKQDAIRDKEFLKAIRKSSRSYDEIMNFLR